jgi:hypothetical protein
MKRYLKPTTDVTILNAETILAAVSRSETEAGKDAVVLGKEGMTPVSEDNANSIWED